MLDSILEKKAKDGVQTPPRCERHGKMEAGIECGVCNTKSLRPGASDIQPLVTVINRSMIE